MIEELESWPFWENKIDDKLAKMPALSQPSFIPC